MNDKSKAVDKDLGEPVENSAEPGGDSVEEQENDATDGQNSVDDALAEAESKAEKNWDLYLRAAAEVENLRKRAVREVENAHKFAVDKMAAELLGVKDSLELGLEAAIEADDVEALRKGKEATLKLLETVLEKFSIVEINPQGEQFNPELHEARAMQPSADHEPGSVLQVVQKGYQIHDRLLRPARVIVAREAEQAG